MSISIKHLCIRTKSLWPNDELLRVDSCFFQLWLIPLT